jgi:hypothetical protein
VRRLIAFASAMLLAMVGAVAVVVGTEDVGYADSYAFWFVKNGADQTNSTLAWANVAWTQGGSWTAGSGRPGYDECHTSAMSPIDHGGWLPNGTWQVNLAGSSYNYQGQSVKGPAIRLYDRRCFNGTMRTEIFIHSAFPWATSQYLSQGCVKVSSTGSSPSAPGGDIVEVWNVRAFLAITTVYVTGP